jgi:hypothetical protein
MPDPLKFADLAPRQRTKLLCGLVVPSDRSRLDPEPRRLGQCAILFLFNAICENPALIVPGLQHNEGGSAQDATRNIELSGQSSSIWWMRGLPRP